MRLGLVTCRPLPEPDIDEEVMLSGFAAAGMNPEMVDWRASRGEECDLLIIRSTWDYFLHSAEFAEWLWAVEGRVWNPTAVCLWNLEKRYLLELESKGVPIVPSLFPPEVDVSIPWDRFVVKPTISAGSYMTRVFDSADEAAPFIEEIRKTHDPMIQPYMSSVDGEGERSIILIDGEITHGIRKEPRFADGHEAVSSGYEPSGEERELAMRAIAAAPGPLMYARVDVMRDDAGQLCVSELELLEPSLFLSQNPTAMDKLVEAVRRRA